MSIYLTETADVKATLESLKAYGSVILSAEAGLKFEEVKKFVFERAKDTPVYTRYFHLLVTYGAWFSGTHVLPAEQGECVMTFLPGDTMLLHGHEKDEWAKVVFKEKHESAHEHVRVLSPTP